MESQPQNLEYRNKPENFHPIVVLITGQFLSLFHVMLYILVNNFSAMSGHFLG